MTEIKTLKDFIRTPEEMYPCYDRRVEFNRTILMKELRQNAINWIKKLQYDHPFESGHPVFGMDQYIKGQIDWIKHFFNINDWEL